MENRITNQLSIGKMKTIVGLAFIEVTSDSVSAIFRNTCPSTNTIVGQALSRL